MTKNITTKSVDHNKCYDAYICRHLETGSKLGFFEMEDDVDPQIKQGQCFRVE